MCVGVVTRLTCLNPNAQIRKIRHGFRYSIIEEGLDLIEDTFNRSMCEVCENSRLKHDGPIACILTYKETMYGSYLMP